MEGEILFLGDEPEDALLWAYSLEQRGYTVRVVLALEAAQELLQQAPIQLVVVDASAPATDGAARCAALRPLAPVPILLLTARRDEPHALAAYAAGADEVVARPLDPPLFLAKVTAWLRWGQPAAMLRPAAPA